MHACNHRDPRLPAQPGHPANSAATLRLCRRAVLMCPLSVGLAWQALPAYAELVDDGDARPSAAVGVGQSPSNAVRELYDRSASSYDSLDDGPLASALGFPALRSQLLAKAHGDVLELAVGTGLNLPCYPWQQLTSLTATDISSNMLSEAQRRAAALGLPLPPVSVRFQQADAAELAQSLPGRSFDCIVDTFSLCTFERPLESLQNAAQLLRPSGRLLLLEHARSRQPLLGAYQDATAAVIARTGGRGCMWNQPVSELVTTAGFEIVSLEEHLGGLLISLEARLA